MKVPLRWLYEYVDSTLPIEQLAERMTLSGTLVEGIERTGTDWDDIVTAEVVYLEPHPVEDHLQLATVNLGNREQMAVTSASNIVVGDRVPFIGIGGHLPDGRVVEAYGFLSDGMLLAEDELGLSEDHSGIYVLDPDTPAGRPLAEVLGDVVFDVDITPNRPDCLSIVGLAREVAAISGQHLCIPRVRLTESNPSVNELITVQINDPDLCPRYTLRAVTGITVGPSPAWLVRRLHAAGLRSVNNVVDISNYVMLEWGQPLHTFDLDKVSNRQIVVRRAQSGETLETLDGATHYLTPDMLLIADAERAIGLAGIMGAAHSEITPATSAVLIESANFVSSNIKRTARLAGLRTEASMRFEKGLPWYLPPLALDRAAGLIARICGGVIHRDSIDIATPAPPRRVIKLAEGEISRLLGIHLDQKQISANLQPSGFALTPEGATGSLWVSVPLWRDDIREPANLAGEVARMLGYDTIPTGFPSGAVAAAPPSLPQRWEKDIRHFLLASGLTDLMTYSLISASSLSTLFVREQLETRPDPAQLAMLVPNPEGVRKHGAQFDLLQLTNPLSSEQELLRPTLLPGLIKTLRANLQHTQEGLAFFELARCYYPRPDDLPYERLTLGITIAGLRDPRTWWNNPPENVDFYDLKGIVQELLDHCGVPGYRFEAAQHPALHPGRTAHVLTDEGQHLGYLGELHPTLASSLDLKGTHAYFLELDADLLQQLSTEVYQVQPVSRFPVIKRDIAVIVPKSVEVAAVETAIAAAGGYLLKEVRVFDVYAEEPVPTGYKSVACALTLQAADRTLSDFEADEIFKHISRQLLADVGGRVRDTSIHKN